MRDTAAKIDKFHETGCQKAPKSPRERQLATEKRSESSKKFQLAAKSTGRRTAGSEFRNLEFWSLDQSGMLMARLPAKENTLSEWHKQSHCAQRSGRCVLLTLTQTGGSLLLAAIPRRMHRISSDLRRLAAQCPVRTGDWGQLGTPPPQDCCRFFCYA